MEPGDLVLSTKTPDVKTMKYIKMVCIGKGYIGGNLTTHFLKSNQTARSPKAEPNISPTI